VIDYAPEIIIGSWCGKHFRPERVAARPGWENIPAVKNGKMYEIKSAIILTPGPVAISEGLPQLLSIFDL
jgi:iron complex transport system substrate-binding protein